MKTKGLTLIVFLLLVNISMAQSNVDSMIMSQPETKLELINKARNLILDAVESNSKPKVKELQQYLNANYEQSGYVALYPIENLFLYYWLNSYDSVLSYSAKMDMLTQQTEAKIHPISAYNFYTLLCEKVANNETKASIRSAKLSDEQKDFLVIYLEHYMVATTQRLSNEGKLDSALRSLNADKRKYALTYPNSEYASRIKPHEMRLSSWGFTFGLGGGYGINTSKLASNFNNTGLMAMNFEASYKQAVLNWGMNVGGNDTKKDFVAQDNSSVVWQKGSRASYVASSLTLGYRAIEKSRVLVTPFVGVGASFISPSEADVKKYPELDNNFRYTFGPIIPLGVNVDFRVGKLKNIFGQEALNPNFFTLRLSYTFNYQGLPRAADEGFSGNMHCITLAYQVFTRTIKR